MHLFSQSVHQNGNYREREREREREQMIHGFFFFLCLSCLLQSTHNVLYDLYCTWMIYRSIYPSSPPAAILIPFLLLDFFFFFFFKADVQCLGLQVVGGAAEKERAAETVVGGGCIVNEGV